MIWAPAIFLTIFNFYTIYQNVTINNCTLIVLFRESNYSLDKVHTWYKKLLIQRQQSSNNSFHCSSADIIKCMSVVMATTLLTRHWAEVDDGGNHGGQPDQDSWPEDPACPNRHKAVVLVHLRRLRRVSGDRVHRGERAT